MRRPTSLLLLIYGIPSPERFASLLRFDFFFSARPLSALKSKFLVLSDTNQNEYAPSRKWVWKKPASLPQQRNGVSTSWCVWEAWYKSPPAPYPRHCYKHQVKHQQQHYRICACIPLAKALCFAFGEKKAALPWLVFVFHRFMYSEASFIAVRGTYFPVSVDLLCML